MIHTLNEILELEDNRAFTAALKAYDILYSHHPTDYEVWKHYFFLLWEVVEEIPESDLHELDVRPKMQRMLWEGQRKFALVADFNFIAGYAVAMFPYEFGDYHEQLQMARQLLATAYRIAPDNSIYHYMCSSFNEMQDKTALKRLEEEALDDMRRTFAGKGMLNKYFRQVLLPNDI